MSTTTIKDLETEIKNLKSWLDECMKEKNVLKNKLEGEKIIHHHNHSIFPFYNIFSTPSPSAPIYEEIKSTVTEKNHIVEETKMYKMKLSQYLENLKLQKSWVLGDGYCSIYAVYESYLCIDKPFLIDNKGNDIDTPNKLSVYLSNFIRDNKSIIKDTIVSVDQEEYLNSEFEKLIIQLSKNTSTIVSDIIFYILSYILEIRIVLVFETTSNEINVYTFDANTNKVKEEDKIYIYGNGAHYSSLINENIKLNLNDNKNFNTFRNNMINMISSKHNDLKIKLKESLYVDGKKSKKSKSKKNKSKSKKNKIKKSKIKKYN